MAKIVMKMMLMLMMLSMGGRTLLPFLNATVLDQNAQNSTQAKEFYKRREIQWPFLICISLRAPRPPQYVTFPLNDLSVRLFTSTRHQEPTTAISDFSTLPQTKKLLLVFSSNSSPAVTSVRRREQNCDAVHRPERNSCLLSTV